MQNQPQQSQNNSLPPVTTKDKLEDAAGKAHISVGTVPLNRLPLRSKIAVERYESQPKKYRDLFPDHKNTAEEYE